VLISRDLKEFGVQRFGAENNPGHEIMKWVMENYQLEKRTGADPLTSEREKGVVIWRRK
jgi:hypothetical protein